ncbi:Rossmann-fold NAD(P)-binding domain-containing protein [Pontibacter akesuensis]|uniref:N-succinylornithine carbamoyltransferase n=1 Tax=Pontibacter akesuensis TaxID=388950 RepID=A0A1I7FZ35_9BACT|nr:acetylornithine carbamoyltransferase [Pontibacter akesuensis]GHA59846.1 N-acetylornithine carbamoyltransferase [Pontibacter akesuensis]SFU41326.1 ornithine carbamoyltransferase [Pontibacter akesuensis]
MKQFTSIKDVQHLDELVNEALALKQHPFKYKTLGENKTLGLIFLNPSLRTRLSTQKAGQNLGMNVIVMNLDKEGWALETQEGTIMNGNTVEHIKDAAAVMGQYCDIIGIRSFPKLQNREEDYQEELLQQFIKYSKVPVVSLESATRHPLQSLADLVTITESTTSRKRPKVVLTWAPHIKPIPQCVANSFAEWMSQADVELVITHPEGYELADEFTQGATITTNQDEAMQNADFVYVKNWSSYRDYGQVLTDGAGWMLTNEKLQQTNSARVMHCLPVRRNVELSDEILEGPNSLVLEQANNRTYAAQAVLKRMLEAL